MSVSVCSISGQPLTNPVASIKTGHLYERDTIEKHLSSLPYCPITNQPMGPADLVPILRTLPLTQHIRGPAPDRTSPPSPTSTKFSESMTSWCWTASN